MRARALDCLTSAIYYEAGQESADGQRAVAQVVLNRVRTHPSRTTLNGTQDIEAALKEGNWWRKLNVPIGQCEPGPFTHERLDR